MNCTSLAIPLAFVLHLAAQQPRIRLAEIARVCVDQLGQAEGADVVHEQLINLLHNSKQITIIETAGLADATITGVARIDKGQRFAVIGGLAAGRTTYDVTLLVRLIGNDKTTLWAYDASKGCRMSVPACAVRDLVKAMDRDRKEHRKLKSVR